MCGDRLIRRLRSTRKIRLEHFIRLAIDRAEMVGDLDLVLFEKIDEHLAVLIELLGELKNPILGFRRF